MKLPLLNRRIHYWAAIIVAAPLLVVAITGVLLQLKKNLTWVQPPEQKGTSKEPAVSFDRILETCREVPEAEVRSWDDIARLDVRPSKGLIKVTATNNWELQLDAKNGDLLQAAFRRSDIIEAMHDGSWFHERAKLGIFLPAALLLLVLWITGMYLFWLPRWVRWRRRRGR